MKTLNFELTNCHGIRALDATLDFGDGNAVAIYAPNGTMKTSFARTFKDLACGKDSVDNVFHTRSSSSRTRGSLTCRTTCSSTTRSPRRSRAPVSRHSWLTM